MIIIGGIIAGSALALTTIGAYLDVRANRKDAEAEAAAEAEKVLVRRQELEQRRQWQLEDQEYREVEHGTQLQNKQLLYLVPKLITRVQALEEDQNQLIVDIAALQFENEQLIAAQQVNQAPQKKQRRRK